MNTQDTLADLLRPDELRGWAESKAPHAHVGATESNTECPIARYLNECTADEWSVADGCVSSISAGQYEHDPALLPSWARRLVEIVDSMTYNYVTREELLVALELVEQDADADITSI